MLFGNSVNVTADNSHILTLIHTSPKLRNLLYHHHPGRIQSASARSWNHSDKYPKFSEYRDCANILNSSRQWKAQRILIDKTTDVRSRKKKGDNVILEKTRTTAASPLVVHGQSSPRRRQSAKGATAATVADRPTVSSLLITEIVTNKSDILSAEEIRNVVSRYLHRQVTQNPSLPS